MTMKSIQNGLRVYNTVVLTAIGVLASITCFYAKSLVDELKHNTAANIRQDLQLKTQSRAINEINAALFGVGKRESVDN